MNTLDNHAALSTYELAELLESIPESNAALAKKLGRSRTYVSRMRNTMRHACDSLRMAWKEDKLSYDMVKRIAKIRDPREQSRALVAYLQATKINTRAAKGAARAAVEALRKTDDTEEHTARCGECCQVVCTCEENLWSNHEW